MKKFLLLLPILTICACDNMKTYVVGDTAVCTGLEETDQDSVFCKDNQDRPINGIVKQYYENGNIWREMTIRDGRENGIEREYYENGNLHVVANIVDGHPDGNSQLFNEDGKLIMEINWDNNQVKSIKKYDDFGNLIEEAENEDIVSE